MNNDLAWLAGIIEGEGCIDIKRYKAQRDTLRIRVKMTDEDVIQRVASLFGTSYYSEQPTAPNRKMIFIASITGKKAWSLAKEIDPLLGKRRKERLEACQ